MERRGNYFMPNNGQIGFSPLHMLGLSAIHKSMQHGFVDVSANTHTVDNNFSLFKCGDQDTEIVNLKNNLNSFAYSLPTRNSFSKLIGGFIGSKCLIGSSTGRENNFWGTVLQQYNSIMGTNSNLYISMPAMSTKENSEYIKAGAVDAALLFSQSFGLFSTNNLISQEQTMDTTKSVSPHEAPELSVEMQAQETVTTEPKQSYAEVTKSGVFSKSLHSAASDRCSTGSKRLRPAQRNPEKLRQKKQSLSISPNNSWRYQGHHDVFDKYMASADYSRGPHRKHCIASHDNQRKSVEAKSSIKGTLTSEDLKMNHARTRHVQHSTSNRKFSGKRKLNSNLLSDIKEDCLGVDDDMTNEKKAENNPKFSLSSNEKLTTSNDRRSVSNYCTNWRCRPYSLCDPCKMKNSYGNDVPDCCGPHIQHETIFCEIGEKEYNVPELPATPLLEGKPDVSSAKPVSCSDSGLTGYEILIGTGCPIVRTRISSECSVDSEDSFIIMFDASADDSYEETSSSETASVCSGSDSSEDDDASSINSQLLTYEQHSDHDDNYDFDDYEIDFDDYDDAELEALISISETELKEANARWETAYEDMPSVEKEPEKVHFANTSELTTVHKIIAWDFAYRAARLGPWELIARDRIRFRRRIEHMNRILSPILQDHHRRHLWQKFHKETLAVP